MARGVQDVLKDQLGSLLMEIAILTAKNEKIEEELQAMKTAVREPDKKLSEVK